MAERRTKLKLGLFMGGTLVALAALVVLFGSAPTLFSNRAHYTITYPEAPGIGPGTPIRKSGVRIGEVTKLELDPDSGQVRVHIAIDPKYALRTGEDATITRGLLSGDTAIDFLPKLDPTTAAPLPKGDDYKPGSEIVGVPPITPRSLLTPASGVLASAQASLDRMVTSFERLEKVSPQLEATLREFELLASDVRKFIPELKKTNDKLQKFIGGDVKPQGFGANGKPLPIGMIAAFQDQPEGENNLPALIRDVRTLIGVIRPTIDDIRVAVRRMEPELTGAAKSARIALDRAGGTFEALNEVLSPENRKEIAELIKNLNGVSANVLKLSGTFQGVLEETDKAIRNFDKRTAPIGDILNDVRGISKPLAEKSGALVKDISESAAALSKVLGEVREVVRVFGRENGTLQKLLTEPGVYQNLDAAAASLAKVLARADKIGRDLEVFADKVARRPELIGVGGALRPSAGLKESPFAPVPRDLPSYRPEWPPAIPATRHETQWHPGEPILGRPIN
ncbi:MAG: MlaD family protein [Gemmataceae bacterium]